MSIKLFKVSAYYLVNNSRIYIAILCLISDIGNASSVSLFSSTVLLEIYQFYSVFEDPSFC
jgi:hypothetical protein